MILRWTSPFLALLLASFGCDRDDPFDPSQGPEGCARQETEGDCGRYGAASRGRDGGGDCAWVEIHTAMDGGCGEASTPTCIAMHYQGAGCLVAHSCGAQRGPNTYVSEGDGAVRYFELETCEWQPAGDAWSQCSWTSEAPQPIEACDCVCE
jgi:hypothetical protein